MKLNSVIWGIVLLFIGGILLLENFNIIEFYWTNVWRFWPALLIIAGLNILFNRQRSRGGNTVFIVVLIVLLGFLFYKGQERPGKMNWIGDDIRRDLEDDSADVRNLTFFEPFNGDSTKDVALNIYGGGTSFSIKNTTDSLIFADVKKRRGTFSLKRETTDSLQTLTFKTERKGRKWPMGDGGNEVELSLNKSTVWNVAMNMGAGEVNFDLSAFKIRKFNFEGGAAALDVKLGDRMPVTDVLVKTGMADVKIHIPQNSGCRITAETGLSAKDFTGFTKLDNGIYETPNYKSSAKKIYIRLNGGLSSFEVGRY